MASVNSVNSYLFINNTHGWFTYLLSWKSQSKQAWPAYGRPCGHTWWKNPPEQADRWRYVLRVVNRDDLSAVGQDLISKLLLPDANLQKTPVTIDPCCRRGMAITSWWRNCSQLLMRCFKSILKLIHLFANLRKQYIHITCKSGHRMIAFGEQWNWNF